MEVHQHVLLMNGASRRGSSNLAETSSSHKIYGLSHSRLQLTSQRSTRCETAQAALCLPASESDCIASIHVSAGSAIPSCNHDSLHDPAIIPPSSGLKENVLDARAWGVENWFPLLPHPPQQMACTLLAQRTCFRWGISKLQ